MRIIKKYRIYLFLFIASLLTVIIHEYGHFLMGTVLGYNMGFDFNGSRPFIGTYANNTHFFLVLIGGISFTIVQSYLAFYLMKKLNYKVLYYLVLTPFLYRLMPYLISIIYPNRLLLQDEARVGNLLGINLYIIPTVILFVLLFNCYRANKKYKISFQKHLQLSLISIISFLIIIRLNQLLMISI